MGTISNGESGSSVRTKLNDIVNKVEGNASIGNNITITGVTTAATFEPNGDTSAGDNAAIGYTAAEGLILTGQGSTNDVTIKNDADADVLEIPTGTTNVTIAGNLGVGGTVTATGNSVFASLDISGDIDVDGTTNLDVVDIDGAVDMASTLTVGGNVGIGTAPSQKLHVSGGNLQLVNGSSTLYLGDGPTLVTSAPTSSSAVRFDSDNLLFSYSNNEKMRIDSSGNLLVGTSDTSLQGQSSNTGFRVTTSGTIQSAATSDVSFFNRLATDGDIIRLQKDGTTVGIIGTIGGDTITIGSGDTGLLMNQTNDEIIPWNTSTNAARDGFIDLGDASHRFKDLYLSGSIHGDVKFENNAGTTEYARFDSNGNVGIGTSSITTGTLGPLNKFLEVAAGTASGSGTLILSRDTSTDNDEVGGIRFVNANNADDDGLDADGKLIAGISIRLETSDSNAGDDSGGHMTFSTKPEAGNFAERMRIDSNGNVGIACVPNSSSSGVAGLSVGDGGSPLGSLVSDGASNTETRLGHGYYFDGSNYKYETASVGVAIYQQLGSNAGAQHIWFSNAGGSEDATFTPSERMRIDSSGNLLVGAISAVGLGNGTNEGISISSSQKQIIVGTDSDVSLYLNRQTSDGDIAVFRKNGSTVGSIGNASGTQVIYLSGNQNAVKLVGPVSGVDSLGPSSTSGGNRDNAMDLGWSSNRFKDLYLSGSVKLPNCTLEDQVIKSNTFIFKNGAGTAEYARFDSSGNLLVGTTDTTIYNDAADEYGFMVEPSGQMQLSANNATMLYLNRQNGDGTIVDFRKDGQPVGIIGTIGGDTITIGSGDTGLLMNQTNDEIIPWNTSTNAARDGFIDLGDASHRFKDLYLSGGIQFDSRSNKLDDYEEGTFDVTLSTTGGSVTLNSVYNKMSYTKIGRQVTVFGLIITSGVSSPTGAYAHIDSLPFTSANLTEGSGRSGGGIFYWDGANAHVKPWEISESSNRLSIYMDASTLTSGDDFYFSCSYQTT